MDGILILMKKFARLVQAFAVGGYNQANHFLIWRNFPVSTPEFSALKRNFKSSGL
jgi:hypothetical protein